MATFTSWAEVASSASSSRRTSVASTAPTTPPSSPTPSAAKPTPWATEWAIKLRELLATEPQTTPCPEALRELRPPCLREKPSEKPSDLVSSLVFMPASIDVRVPDNINPGNPRKHPAVVLPSTGLDLNPGDWVDVLSVTSIDIVLRSNSDVWASRYLPISDKAHPYRTERLSYKQGSLPEASSVNVGTVYTVPWRELVPLKSGPVRLTDESMEKISRFVANPTLDLPRKQHNDNNGSDNKSRKRGPSSSPSTSSPRSPPTSPRSNKPKQPKQQYRSDAASWRASPPR